MSLITPRTPPGTLELLPAQQMAFQRFLATIRDGFERFGFVPVETPVFETTDVLLGKTGGETEKQVYFVQSTGSRQQGHEPDLALKFDLTVPLARYVAQHEKGLAFPFRRYQMQRVYRGERAQKGRYREFYQCDVDVIGKDQLPLLYDAEMPAVIAHIFETLRIGDFTISINNRKLLQGLLEALGLQDNAVQTVVVREIDKLDKIGPEGVDKGLADPEIGLGAEPRAKLLRALTSQGDHGTVLETLAALGSGNARFDAGHAEIVQVLDTMLGLGVAERRVRINPAIARGLDYYTGTVYETHLDTAQGLGSIASGGRYEDLASHYTKSRLPGVGISIGATRLFSHLLANDLVDLGHARRRVLVTCMDRALVSDYLDLARRLRDAGIATELQFEAAKLAKQMKYADRAGFGWVLIMGEDEKLKGTVTLKDLVSGQQEQVGIGDLTDHMKSRIESV